MFGFVAITLATQPSLAQSEPMGLMPASMVEVNSDLKVNEETHPPLRLTPDVSQIINLDRDVQRVIVGNNNHVNVLMDTSKRLIVVPRGAGATHFTLLDENGQVVMQRHVIVAAPAEKYVRIRQSCGFSGNNCEPVRMYYCPGMCHEIGMNAGSGGGSASLSGVMSSSGNNAGDIVSGDGGNNSNDDDLASEDLSAGDE